MTSLSFAKSALITVKAVLHSCIIEKERSEIFYAFWQGIAERSFGLWIEYVRNFSARKRRARSCVSGDTPKFRQGERENRSEGLPSCRPAPIKNNKVTAIRFSTLAAICDVLQCEAGDILEFQKD